MNFDGLFNYYERLVYDEIMRQFAHQTESFSNSDAEDIACLALNQLPTRYVRHSVDTAYFLKENDREKMDHDVTHAVLAAMQRVRTHPGVPD